VLPLYHAELRHTAAGTRRWLTALVAASIALTTGPRPAPGQDGPSRVPSGRPPALATLVGTVDDGLRGGPLAGAVILLDGQSRQAVTDSIGWFRLDSVAAGRYRVGIFHPVLDSLGTSLASTPVTLVAGRPKVVTFATPSGRTIRKAVCPGVPSNSSSGSNAGPADSAVAVLVGHVVEPDTDEPVSGADVTLIWTDIRIDRSEIANTEQRRETTSDTQGEFRFCALPAGLVATVRAKRAVGRDTGVVVEREVDLGARIITMTTLHLPVPPAPALTQAEPGATAAVVRPAGPAAPAPHATATRAAVLEGQVERPDGGPLAGALVEVEGTGDSSTTGDAGYFTIRGLPSGTHMLVVRSVGFEPTSVVVELTRRQPQHVVVSMMKATYVLSTVVVQAQQLARGYLNVGFSQRRKVGVGQFMTLDQIAARHAEQFTDLFTNFHGIRLAYGGPAGTDISPSRGIDGCIVYVIDGMPFNQMVHGELDAMLLPESLAGIEVYTPPEVPEEFKVRSLPGTNAFGVPILGRIDCTTIVIWSKNRLGVKD
jgi:Carboxypeptidase regulatory-like domain